MKTLDELLSHRGLAALAWVSLFALVWCCLLGIIKLDFIVGMTGMVMFLIAIAVGSTRDVTRRY